MKVFASKFLEPICLVGRKTAVLQKFVVSLVQIIKE